MAGDAACRVPGKRRWQERLGGGHAQGAAVTQQTIRASSRFVRSFLGMSNPTVWLRSLRVSFRRGYTLSVFLTIQICLHFSVLGVDSFSDLARSIRPFGCVEVKVSESVPVRNVGLIFG